MDKEKMSLQERNFLLLDERETTKIVKDILKSPLKLARKLINMLFEQSYSELKENLDEIKEFVGGIARARTLEEYSLAKYYSTMFAFHQFFNSSFRARQGKVLEAVMKEVLQYYTNSTNVPHSVAEMQQIVQEIFQLETKPTLDIDALGYNVENNNLIIIQIRSRDDTGGTTAKGSLADFLRELLRSGNIPKAEVTYLIAVWDARDSVQRKSTISKVYLSLKEHIDVSEEDFIANIERGVEIIQNVNLQLAYGIDEISTALFNWSKSDDKKILSAIEETVTSIVNWDDLWIAYAIASLELERISFGFKSNVELLERYLSELKVDEINVSNLDKTAINLAMIWRDDSIPLPSVADRILYIRDMLYLKLINEQ